MNILQQLELAAGAMTVPAPSGGTTKAKQRQLNGVRLQRYNAAFALYQRTMQGKGWMRGNYLDQLMGYAHAGTKTFLARLEKEGYVEHEDRNLEIRHVTRPVRFYRWIDKDQDLSVES